MKTSLRQGRARARAPRLARLLPLALALTCVAPARAQQRVGYVLDARCDWVMDGRPVGPSTPVNAGGVVSLRNANAPNCGIVILNNNGGVLARRDCNRARECDQAIRLPPAPPPPSVLRRVADAVWGLMGANPPERYESTASRDKNLHESVLLLKDGRVDFSPVFRSVEAGDYEFQLTPVRAAPADPAPAPAGRFALPWRPAQTQPLPVGELRPGLYELTLLERVGEELAPSDIEVWVLIAEADRYGPLALSFAEAASLTESWADEVRPGVKHAFLKTYLDHLSR